VEWCTRALISIFQNVVICWPDATESKCIRAEMMNYIIQWNG
jgi:hypothetical protein